MSKPGDINNAVPCISIVMAVYTNEKYFNIAIDSLFAQSFTDYELILIDDACRDEGVARRLEELAQLDNVTVIHNSCNCGAAVCRNKGLELVRGRYVIFLDADDYFAPDMLQKMADKIISEDADLCICSYNNFIDEGRITASPAIPEEISPELRASERYLISLNDMLWTKLIRTDFIRRNGLYFQNISSSNDVFFSVMSLMLADKVVCINEQLVNYRQDSKSAISRKRDAYNCYRAYNEILKHREDRSFEGNKAIYYMFVTCSNNELYRSSRISSNIRLCKEVCRMNKVLDMSFENENLNRKLRRLQLGGGRVYPLWVYAICRLRQFKRFLFN